MDQKQEQLFFDILRGGHAGNTAPMEVAFRTVSHDDLWVCEA